MGKIMSLLVSIALIRLLYILGTSCQPWCPAGFIFPSPLLHPAWEASTCNVSLIGGKKK